MAWRFWKSSKYFDFAQRRRSTVVLYDIISALTIAITNLVLSIAPILAGTGIAYGIGVVAAYAIVAGAVMGLNMAVSSLTSKSGKKGNMSSGGLLMNSRMVTDPIKIIYGKRRVGASQVFIHSEGTFLNRKLHMICVWCEGPIEGVSVDGAGEEIYIGERRIQDFQTYLSRNFVTHTFYDGSADQTVDASLASIFPEFADAMRYTAYSYFVFSFHQSLYSGFPTVTAVLKGRKLFDPRDGSISYSTNPALVWRDFKTHPRYGGGIAGSLIDSQSANDAATWCSSNGYEFNGVISDRQSFLDNIEDILINFRGEEIWTGGQYKFLIQTYSTPVIPLDERDIKTDDSGKNALGIQTAGIQDSPTRVKVTFGDRLTNYIPSFAYWPQVPIIVSEGVELDRETKEIELIGVVEYTQALKIAKYLFLEARWSRSFSAVVHPRLLALELGDMVQVSHNTDLLLGSIPEDWNNKVLRIASCAMTQDNQISVVFGEESADIYDDTVEETTPHYPYNTTTPNFFTTPPDPDNLTFQTGPDAETPDIIDAYVEFTWDHMGDGLDYKLRYRYDNVSVWRSPSIKVPSGVLSIPVKTGTGTLNLQTSGDYYAITPKNYKIEIDGIGNPNTFKWSDDGGSTYEATGVPITYLQWQGLNNGAKIKFNANSGGVVGDYWLFTATPQATVTERVGGFRCGKTVNWQVQAVSEKNLKSEWITPTNPVVTWSPGGPIMADVVLSVSSEGSAIILSWEKATSDFNIFKWIIYRNTTNNSATAIPIGSSVTRTYQDLTVNTGTTYYYWLKAVDRFDAVSSNFSPVGYEGFLHRVTSPIFDTVGSGDIPAEQGSTALIADTITLDNCDDYTDFQDDATDPADIIIEQDTVNCKQGTGSVKITVNPYRKKLFFESSYGSPYKLGCVAPTGYKYASQGFKPTTNITCKAIGLKILKVGTPSNLIVDIYSDNGGKPNVSIATATLLVADIPTSLGIDPFVYVVFGSTVSLTSGTLYHIVLDAQSYSLSNYYNVYGYFKNFGTVDNFGGAGEMFHDSGNKTTWSDVLSDIYDCWDMNFRICETSTALNKHVWATIASKDLSLKTDLKFWAMASRAGTNFKICFGETNVWEQLFDVAIITANTWEFKDIDISGISGGSRDAVTKVGIKITNLDSENVIHLDHIFTNVEEPTPKIYIGGAWRSYVLDDDPIFTDPIFTRRVTVCKASDESVVSSTVYQNDNDLLLAVGISEKWAVKLQLMGNNGDGAFKMKFTVPANGKFYWWPIGDATNIPFVPYDETSVIIFIDFGFTRMVYSFEGIYVGGNTAGTLQLQWAQSASNGTATKVLASSFLIADRLSPL